MVLAGGGCMGLVYIGALRYIIQEELDKNIRHVYGTSIGAFFGTAYVLGIGTDVLEHYFKTIFREGLNKTDISNILYIHKKLGIDDNTNLMQLIIDKAENVTFLEIAKRTGKNLVICATHISTMTPTYFSMESTPHVRVIDALRASMAVPMIFTPVQIGDDYYVDGCVTEGIPISKILQKVKKENILVMNLENSSTKLKPFDFENTNLLEYFGRIIQPKIMDYQITLILKSTYPYIVSFINIPIEAMPIKCDSTYIQLCVDEKTIDDCYTLGYSTMYEHVKRWSLQGVDIAK
jgi:NTE family protein